MNKAIEKQEIDLFNNDDSPETPPPDILAYNELRSCADLFRMWKSKVLEIQPDFQRDVVWKNPDKTRFIDSLAKQLPIPSMCFSLDYKTQRWQVIDGLQRMSTIIGFLSGKMKKLSALKDIDPAIAGKQVAQFIDENSELHSYYTRIENLTIPITVLRCDNSKPSHTHYLFTIFHRLNTGGMKLNNQEIRNCIFSGNFNKLLKAMDGNEEWREINKMKNDESYRFTKQELILRFFAFHDTYEQYTGRLARFLNDYMNDRRHIESREFNKKKKLFEQTIDIVYRKVFGGVFKSKISITLLEALLVGVSFNIKYLKSLTSHKVHVFFEKLQRHEEFTDQKLSEGLSGKPRVIGRITAAKKIFSGK